MLASLGSWKARPEMARAKQVIPPPPQGCTESQKAFSQDKKFNMRNEDLRPDEPEGDKHYEDF